jgi:hypothetical protein
MLAPLSQSVDVFSIEVDPRPNGVPGASPANDTTRVGAGQFRRL